MKFSRKNFGRDIRRWASKSIKYVVLIIAIFLIAAFVVIYAEIKENREMVKENMKVINAKGDARILLQVDEDSLVKKLDKLKKENERFHQLQEKLSNDHGKNKESVYAQFEEIKEEMENQTVEFNQTVENLHERIKEITDEFKKYRSNQITRIRMLNTKIEKNTNDSQDLHTNLDNIQDLSKQSCKDFSLLREQINALFVENIKIRPEVDDAIMTIVERLNDQHRISFDEMKDIEDQILELIEDLGDSVTNKSALMNKIQQDIERNNRNHKDMTNILDTFMKNLLIQSEDRNYTRSVREIIRDMELGLNMTNNETLFKYLLNLGKSTITAVSASNLRKGFQKKATGSTSKRQSPRPAMSMLEVKRLMENETFHRQLELSRSHCRNVKGAKQLSKDGATYIRFDPCQLTSKIGGVVQICNDGAWGYVCEDNWKSVIRTVTKWKLRVTNVRTLLPWRRRHRRPRYHRSIGLYHRPPLDWDYNPYRPRWRLIRQRYTSKVMDDFKKYNGNVLCKALGFKRYVGANKVSISGLSYKDIMLDDLLCPKNAARFDQCMHTELGSGAHDCHSVNSADGKKVMHLTCSN